LRLVAEPELDGVTGRYFSGLQPVDPHRQASDTEARAGCASSAASSLV
jgi:hypothetical protein